MSHHRTRIAIERLRKLLKASPVIGILGQRQVGKTTLLSEVCRDYVTFDKARLLQQAKSDPELFLNGRTVPFGIDEAQLCPELFPAIKEHVRLNKAVGQFVMSGSVRFTSKKSIRESLTGRILNIEILPFSIAEAHRRANPESLKQCLTLKAERLQTAFDLGARATRAEFSDYLEKGGLPGICFSRDASVRDDRWQTHLDTLINRDYRQLHPTTLPFEAVRDCLVFIAQNQGQPLEWKSLSIASRISIVTIKKVVQTLEGLFLIRPAALLGDAKGITYFLEDQGMASWLRTFGQAHGTGHSTIVTEQDIVRGLYACIRHEILYRPERRGKISTYLTRHGVCVHLVFQTIDGLLGIVVTPDAVPRPKTIAAAQAFLKKFPHARAVIAYGGMQTVVKAENHIWLPYWKLV
jgi:uncharacterized protein